MKKLKIAVFFLGMSMMAAGCGNNNSAQNNSAQANKSTETSVEETKTEATPSTPEEKVDSENENSEFAWAIDAITAYQKESRKQKLEISTTTYEDDSKEEYQYNISMDQDKNQMFTSYDFGDGNTMLEYYEKTDDGKEYYYISGTDGKFVRSETEDGSIERAFSISGNGISTEGYVLSDKGEEEFDGKNVIALLMESKATLYEELKTESIITQEQIDANEDLKNAVEQAKNQKSSYTLYFDKKTKAFVGSKQDNTISDIIAEYEENTTIDKKIKHSEVIQQFVTGDDCTEIKVPTEFTEDSGEPAKAPEGVEVAEG